ncbi:MAG: DNA-deoxyinosine glycosylase [Rhizorhabdus sp.]|uniref:DNA-deoxyinosine glycosylase n=1 Tax=Rhizorhabdus sp. TaxID=1968843 RepID=UPI001B69C42B|nr:DNA-deoxyinosine glycosylase [Rhizorhabdus sp.]MBP8235375.1 DNA-deoxyinosine glycosylase [Rhizorhabdus sp.]
MTRKASFPPVVRADTKLLLLGSLPGEASLRADRYYAHPQNQFWKLAGAVAGLVDLPERPYDDRLASLLDAGIGLWDVVSDALRCGSLDAAIRDHRTNDLVALIETLPELRGVGFNGGTAARIGRKLLEGVAEIQLFDLPSSSPAYTLALAAKTERWSMMRVCLQQ